MSRKKGGYHSGLHGIPGHPTAEESTEDRSLIAFLKDQKSRFEERDGLERDAETQRMKEENDRRVRAILDEESKRDKSARPEGTFQRSRALEKLRNMEWKRNMQDHSEITRDQNEKHAVMKTLPHKEQESVYFSGTRPEKLKGRKKGNRELSTTVRLEELERPPDLDTRPRFTQAPPPPDNAWSKKSGSELFNLPPVKSQEQIMLEEAIAASLLTYQVEKTRFPSSQIEYQEEVDNEYPIKDPFLSEVSKERSKATNNGGTTKPLSAYDDKNSGYEGQDWIVYNDNKLHSQRDLVGYAPKEGAKPNRNNTLSTNSDKKLIYKFPSHSSETEENWDTNASDDEVDERTEEKAGRKDLVARVEADNPNSTVSSHLDENINKHCEQNLSKDNNEENTKVNEYTNNLRNDTNTSKTACEKKAENVPSLDLSGHARKEMSVHVNESSDQICVEQFLRFIPSSEFPQDSSSKMVNKTRVCESDAHYSIANTSSGPSSVKDATLQTRTPRAVSSSSDVNDNLGYSFIPATHGCVDTPLIPISCSAGNKTPVTTTVTDLPVPRTESNGLPPGIPNRPWSSIGDFNNTASNVPNWLNGSGQTENMSSISGGDTTNPFFLKNNEHPNSVPNKDISATPHVLPHLLEQMMYINQNMNGMRLSAGGEPKIYPYSQTLPLVQPGGGVNNAGNMAVGAEAQSNAYYPAFHPNMALPCDQLSANMPQESREANQTSAAFQLHQQAALMQANWAVPQINMQNPFGVHQIPPLLNTHFGGNALLPRELLMYQLQLQQQYLLQEMMNQSSATREQMTAPQKQYLTQLMTSSAAKPNTVTGHTSGVDLHPQQNTALSHSSEVNLYPQQNTVTGHTSGVDLHPQQNTALSHSSEVNLYPQQNTVTGHTSGVNLHPQQNTALSHSSEVNLYPQPNTALSHSSEVNLYPQPNTALSHSSEVNLYPQPNTALSHSSGVNLYPQNTALAHSSGVNLYPQPNTALSHSSGVNLHPQQNTALSHSSGVNLYPQNTALAHSSGVNLYPQNTALAHSSGVNLYPQQNTALAHSSGVNLYPQQNTALAHSSGVNLYPQQNTALAHSSGVNLYPQPNTALSHSSGVNLHPQQNTALSHSSGVNLYPQNTALAHSSGVNLYPQNTALAHSSGVNLYPQQNTALAHSSGVNLYPQQNTALAHSSGVNLYPQQNTALAHSSGVNLYPQPNTALAHSSGVNLYPQQNTALAHSSGVNLYPQQNTALAHSSGVNLYPQQNTALAHSSGVNLYPQQNTALAHSSGVNLYPQQNTALAHSSGVNLYPQQNTALAHSSGVNLYPQPNTALAHSSGVNLYPQPNTALSHSSGVNLHPQQNTALSHSSGVKGAALFTGRGRGRLNH
uniref:Uncharacterized protein n=1 Tax=Timema shepardi TaxID=629360 RepID=A0A7R9AZF1_TIMSH|nr:unnamed protein product [Timema shepardi]